MAIKLISSGSFHSIPFVPNNMSLEFVSFGDNFDVGVKLASKNKIESVHSPWVLKGASPIDKLIAGTTIAQKLGAKYVNFHTPSESQFGVFKKYCDTHEDLEFLLENRYWWYLSDKLKSFSHYVDALESLGLKSTLDLSHAAACKWDILEAADILEEKGLLYALHYSDALTQGNKVTEHLLPGNGNLPLSSLELSRFKLITLEVEPKVFRLRPRSRKWNMDLVEEVFSNWQ